MSENHEKTGEELVGHTTLRQSPRENVSAFSNINIELIRKITNLDITSELYNKILSINESVNHVNEIQIDNKISIVDVYIIVFVGCYNVKYMSQIYANGEAQLDGVFPGLQPTSIKRLSEEMNINRETARRRLVDLTDRGFLHRVERGFFVANWDIWYEMIESYA